jgi:iron-sulfur cluster repair protein YtfE (RIC family)
MTQARMDLYASIHKGLRSFMADTLGAVGRMDAEEAAERQATLAQLRALLTLLEQHAQHEDEFIHPVLQARRPGSAQSCIAEHERQREQLRALRRQAAAVEAEAGARRAAAALDLYRQLALVIADNLAHMHEEETANNAVLWAECTDDELAAIHERIVASVDAEEMAQAVRWMAPSLTPYERTALFGALQAKAPAAAFHRLLEVARPHLAPRDWNKLISGIAAAPLAV